MSTFDRLKAARDAIRIAKNERNELLVHLVGTRVNWNRNGHECYGRVLKTGGERLRVINIATQKVYWVHDFDITSIDDDITEEATQERQP